MLKFYNVFVFLVFFVSVSVVFGCVDLHDGGVYTNSTDVCNGVFFLKNGIIIHGQDVVFDCNSAVIRGDFENSGITIINSGNVTVKDCNVMHFNIGINVQNSNQTVLKGNHLIKNNFGVKFFGSENVFVYGADVSLKSPVRIAGSRGNFIDYFNKRVKDSLCSDSLCNRPLATSRFRNLLDYSPKNLFWVRPFYIDNLRNKGQWSEP
ncbi:hypothetical protein DRJ25_03610 [Candidatus Woesearchaeota archaeon]|nr:MAG: hypothetical protein DRJ25_03610 [Candidatus Woesearchaeota archaeon]